MGIGRTPVKGSHPSGHRLSAPNTGVTSRRNKALYRVLFTKVYWNMIDGAFVDAHPGHKKMGLGVHRSLRDFLNREDIKISNQDGEIETVRTYCKKIQTRV